MSYADYLRGLLQPLGVYDLYAPINGSALDVKGAALDEVHEHLEELAREIDLTRAENWGLTQWRTLFSIQPASEHTEHLRNSIKALLRIGAGACTLESVRDTLSGCGIPTTVEEMGTGTVRVNFPGTAGRPEGFEQLKANIEAILPAHVGIAYIFHFLTWKLVQERNWTFRDIEGLSWDELEKAI